MNIYIEIDKNQIIKCYGSEPFEIENGNTCVFLELEDDDGLDESHRIINGKIVENLLPTEDEINAKIEDVKTLYEDNNFRTFNYENLGETLKIKIDTSLANLFHRKTIGETSPFLSNFFGKKSRDGWDFEADGGVIRFNKEQILAHFVIIEDILAKMWNAKKLAIIEILSIKNREELKDYDSKDLLLQCKEDIILKYNFLS